MGIFSDPHLPPREMERERDATILRDSVRDLEILHKSWSLLLHPRLKSIFSFTSFRC